LFIGSICACGAGAAYPVFTIFLAQIIIATFQLNDGDPSNDKTARDDVNRNALIITLMGIGVFFLNLLEYFLFSVAGEKVTERIRLQAYHKILRMPVEWFDIPRNSGSAVAGRLSIDSQLVNGLTSLLIAVMLHNLATVIAAIIISFIYDWRIGIVGLIVMPLMLLAGFISMLFYGGFGDKS
jgi:ABC-type multidrug transport system fused ATPase/permease subunit